MKGFFTQGATVLFEKAPSVEALASALRPFAPDIQPSSQNPAGRAVRVPLRPGARGIAVVDALDQKWPDGMGNPETDPKLFQQWSLGWFGPLTFPGSLSRAAAHSAAWGDLEKPVARHGAFVRIGFTWAMTMQDSDFIRPPGSGSLEEILFVTRLALAVGGLPGALAYFNPNGESLRSFDAIENALRLHAGGGPPPFHHWMNVREWEAKKDPGWLLLDTVGAAQLDLPDFEAWFEPRKTEPPHVHATLLEVLIHAFQNGTDFADGDTCHGPDGRRWTGSKRREGMMPPSRRTVLWAPPGAKPPTSL